MKHSTILCKRANDEKVVDHTLLDGIAEAVELDIPFDRDGEVEIVDGPPTSPMVFFPIDCDEDDDEVVVTGIALKRHTEHIRVDCPIYTYPKNKCVFLPPSPSKVQLPMALKHCDKCHCYICGFLASECTKWEQHCTAHPKCKKSWSDKYDHEKEAEKEAAATVALATTVASILPAKARPGSRAKKQRST
jgi:hypothetical protein